MAQMKVRLRTKPFLQILARENMSQNSFGRWANLSSGYMSQILSGKRNVSPETRKKILAALPRVDFEQIFSETFSKKR